MGLAAAVVFRQHLAGLLEASRLLAPPEENSGESNP
jgi:hypothetical protein